MCSLDGEAFTGLDGGRGKEGGGPQGRGWQPGSTRSVKPHFYMNF